MSRTAALHQDVFECDELFWLQGVVEKLNLAKAVLSLPQEESLAGWFDSVGEDAFWTILRLGISRPRSHEINRWDRSPRAIAQECVRHKRGCRLQGPLTGANSHWNEMAALRHQTRQGLVCVPVRAASPLRPCSPRAAPEAPSPDDPLP